MTPEQIEANSIIHGKNAVLYIKDENFVGNEPHYFFVLKVDSQLFFLCSATSQIEKQKQVIEARRLGEETLVIIEPEEYQHFTKTTAINCNNVHVKDQMWLIQKVSESDKKILEPLPDHLHQKIIRGVLKSRLVTREQKNKIQSALS